MLEDLPPDRWDEHFVMWKKKGVGKPLSWLSRSDNELEADTKKVVSVPLTCSYSGPKAN
jgi:hypothetical protein